MAPPPLTPPAAKPAPSTVQACPMGYDTRTIVIAFGVGHRPIDTGRDVADDLSGLGLTPKPTKKTEGFWYDARFNHPAFYIVKYIYTKADFMTALATPNIHLIYNGHSRGGLGPCFFDENTADAGGQQWGDQGVFKMGFDFCGTPTEDITHHQYTAHPVPVGTAVDAATSEPAYLRPFVSAITPTQISGAAPLADGQYQAYMAPNPEAAAASPNIQWLPVNAGAADLKATSPQARVFCMFSCDTVHAFKDVVTAKPWPSAADSGFVYYTSAVNQPGDTTMAWLYSLFTFKGSGCGPWKPSLDYALTQTNATLAGWQAAGRWNYSAAMAKGWQIVA